MGGGRRTADYGGGSGTATLVFVYEVDEGDEDTDGLSIEADSLSGGTIRDGSDNDAVLDHDGLAANASHKVDGVKPQLAATGGEVVERNDADVDPMMRRSMGDRGLCRGTSRYLGAIIRGRSPEFV